MAEFDLIDGLKKADAALPKSGGTMTGKLVLSGDASAPMEAVTKKQLDVDAGKLQQSIDAVDTKANNVKIVADAAKASADGSVKKVNGVSPVGGNVIIDVDMDRPQTEYNSIGAYILATRVSIGGLNAGGTTAGSDLYTAATSGHNLNTMLVGTWRCNGYVQPTSTASARTTVWQRVA